MPFHVDLTVNHWLQCVGNYAQLNYYDLMANSHIMQIDSQLHSAPSGENQKTISHETFM